MSPLNLHFVSYYKVTSFLLQEIITKCCTSMVPYFRDLYWSVSIPSYRQALYPAHG